MAVLVKNHFGDEGIEDELTYMVKEQGHDGEWESGLEIVFEEDQGDGQGLLAGGKGDGNLLGASAAEPTTGEQAGAQRPQVESKTHECRRHRPDES